MADLDDFFAKKDKKKSKAKPKFLTAEELAKNLEDSKRETVAVKANKPAVENVVGTANESSCVDQPEVIEEEWKDFVEEDQRKDYTGLKIGQMTLEDDDDGSNNEADDDYVDSDGNTNADSGFKHSAGNGPWKKVIPAEEVTQIPMEMEKPAPKLYISPAVRQSQALPPISVRRVKQRNRTAPDITNVDYFPTLGAARPEEVRKKKNEPAFEEVRHGSRVQRIQEQPTTQQSSVTNRFQSLDEDDS